MSLPLSIVIPSYERSHLVEEFLPSYLQQDPAEIVIVDDCSTTPICKKRIDHISNSYPGTTVSVIHNKERLQQPACRMIGVGASSSKYVMFGEDDVYLPPGLARSLLEQLSSLDADIVAGPIVITKRKADKYESMPNPGRPDRVESVADLTVNQSHQPAHPVRATLLHSIALMDAAIFEHLQFDTGYRGNGFREETDFYLRAAAAGYAAWYVPAPVASHYKGRSGLIGGQHRSGLFSNLLWYESWVFRNNVRLLKNNSSQIAQLRGKPPRPVLESVALLARRSPGLPGRFRQQWLTRA